MLPLYGAYAFCPWNVNEQNPKQVPTREFLFRDYHNDDCITPDFVPRYKKSKYPYACCELGCGMQVWYRSRFVVEPQSGAALAIQRVAGRCNFIGYYVFH